MSAMSTGLAGLTTAKPTVTPAGSEREKLAGAAKQFEAIFVRQMLAAARKSDFGGNDPFGSGGAIDTFREMQDSQFADIASQTGTLGLAQQIEAHLARFVDDGTAEKRATGPATTEAKS